MHSEADAGRRWPVDREMFRIGAQYLLVDPDGETVDEPPAPPLPVRVKPTGQEPARETVGAGV